MQLAVWIARRPMPVQFIHGNIFEKPGILLIYAAIDAKFAGFRIRWLEDIVGIFQGILVDSNDANLFLLQVNANSFVVKL